MPESRELNEPSLDRLNTEVTAAILMAQRFIDGSPDAKTAWLEVAFAEEALTAFTSPQSVEGEVCRRDAVTAALKAGSARYAEVLTRGFLREDLSDNARAAMIELHQRAQDAVLAATGNEDA